jgi:hypothetical protein
LNRTFVVAVRRAVCAGVLSLLGVGPSIAQLNTYFVGKNASYVQTSPNPPTDAFGYGFFAATFFQPGDFTAGTLTYPGPGSPDTLPLLSPTTLQEFSSFATKAALDAAYPFGTYTFNLSGGALDLQSVSLTYIQDVYPSSVPALTPATFNALAAGPDPSQPLNIEFNTFAPAGSDSFKYIQIYGLDGPGQFFQAFTPQQTSVTVPAYTFSTGRRYRLYLYFQNGVGPQGQAQYFEFSTTMEFKAGAETWPSFLWFFYS